jgi:hypothetical protein
MSDFTAYRAGEVAERERIIKLLKVEAGENWGNIPEWSMNEVIALIQEGKNNVFDS